MLKFEIESLEGVEQSIQSLYEKTEAGSYRLKVDGIEDTTGLKTALQKERESNKDAKAKLAELEKAREELERKELEAQNRYKEISEKDRQSKLEAEQKYLELQSKVAKAKRDLMVRELASSMTSDSTEIDVITRFAVDYVTIEGEEVKFSKDEKAIKEELARFVRNKSNGSDDKGNKGGGGHDSATSLKDAKTKADRKAIIEARIKQG